MLGANQIIERKIFFYYVHAKARPMGCEILILAHANKTSAKANSVINLH
jgi:hypothetical protein